MDMEPDQSDVLMDTGDEPSSTRVVVIEGKATITFDSKLKVFYNPTHEVNRDISVLGLQAFIEAWSLIASEKPPEKRFKINILEAMSASGIRAVRYAKELSEVENILANDYSSYAFQSIATNSQDNKTNHIVDPYCTSCTTLMYQRPNEYVAIDLDPYGTPAPYLDAAVQCVRDGGMLLVTATDMAVLAGGNAAESCYAKYGAMSLKSKACHELALRILIHTVQTAANRYGRYVEPLLSLKIDFYVRIFFRVVKQPIKCKETASNTSVVYQCTGCFSLSFQPIGIRKPNGQYGFAQAIVPHLCEICNSTQHVAGPIWTGSIHDLSFIDSMLRRLNTTHAYLNTANRIKGLLSLVHEEVDVPLLYDASQLCSVIKCSTTPMLQMRSAIMNLGYQVSVSHVAPNTIKTNMPNKVLWDVLRAWHKLSNGTDMRPGTPGYNILQKPVETQNIDFHVRGDANPVSRKIGALRFQVNPTKNWGPGMRDSVHSSVILQKRYENQGKYKDKRAPKRLLENETITNPPVDSTTASDGDDGAACPSKASKAEEATTE